MNLTSLKGANWGMGVKPTNTGGSVEVSSVPEEDRLHTSSEDKSHDENERPVSQSKKSKGKQAAHQLAEVPQWEKACTAESTCMVCITAYVH